MTLSIQLNEEQTGQEARSKDYSVVSRVIETLSQNFRDQPSLEQLAQISDMSPTQLQKLFTRWAGLSPKEFLQALTLDHAKQLLSNGASVLDASIDSGLSGPSRLHDLFVTHEALSPGEYKLRGSGLTISYGFHPSVFGEALVMVTKRGLCGLAFSQKEGRQDAFEDMSKRWPNANYIEDVQSTLPYVERIFNPSQWRAEQPIRVVLIGTDFQISVWQALLRIPFNKAVCYSDIAAAIEKPKASRAVGAAVGANPISFVVPCHRALGKTGELTGYHWGLTRKRAILGWESALS